MFRPRFHPVEPWTQSRAPARQRRGSAIPTGRSGSIAAVYQLPAGAPGRGDQPPHIAAAVTITVAVIGGAADEDARTAPTAMPAAVPTMPAPSGGGSRRQCGRAE